MKNTSGTPSTGNDIDGLTIKSNTYGIRVLNGSNSCLTSDNNTFNGNTNTGQWLGADQANLAAWQTASSLDASSTEV